MAVIDASIQQESRERYLTYALSVVSGRALPDVRDGLKPVQRRILYAMLHNLTLRPEGSHRKCAAVVGEVLARYHPHGDIACYEALVRMAQDFSLRYPLVDGQGNFGSLDGDEAAAYRYTEAKLRALAIEVIGEIYEETVPFRANFDGTVEEPVVFPSRVPHLLVNGASGIAVGMATSIPPHNLHDVISALLALSEDPEMPHHKLVTLVKAPDFPTGCQILNTRKDLDDLYKTGRGVVRMRGEWTIEEGNRGKRFIIITSIPYAINKAQLVEKIADLIIEKKVPQLHDVRDESTDVVRVVLELASGADPDVAMAYLFKHTPLESNFPVNLTALVPTASGAVRPEVLSLKDCLQHFLVFREEVVQKRLMYEKKKLEERLHILDGLIKIFDALDEAIKIVRKSEGRSDAAQKLQVRFKLSEIQSLAVVDMRIYQLSKTNIEEIEAEYKLKKARAEEIEKILKSKAKIRELVRKDLRELDEKFGDKRKCKLVRDAPEIEFNEEAYVVHEEVYAITTRDGWVKRIRQTNELSSTRIREGDAILSTHALSTKDCMAFVTTHGNLFIMRVADLPSSSGYGEPIQKSFKFQDGEGICKTFGIPLANGGASVEKQGSLLQSQVGDNLNAASTLLLVSRHGVGFALKVTDVSPTKRTGRRIMKLREGDALIGVVRADLNYAFFTRKASALAIEGKEVPERDSAAIGVQLLGVREDDALVGVIGYRGNAKLLLHLDGGRTKEVETTEVVKGHRALKGNKIVARGEIERVEKL